MERSIYNNSICNKDTALASDSEYYTNLLIKAHKITSNLISLVGLYAVFDIR